MSRRACLEVNDNLVLYMYPTNIFDSGIFIDLLLQVSENARLDDASTAIGSHVCFVLLLVDWNRVKSSTTDFKKFTASTNAALTTTFGFHVNRSNFFSNIQHFTEVPKRLMKKIYRVSQR